MTTHPSSTVSPIPLGYHSLTCYILLRDVQGFVDFLRTAFDAQVVRQFPGPDGTPAHAEVRMGDSHLMIGDPRDEQAVRPGTLYFYVPSVDLVYKQALEAGATSISAPTDMFYGDRNAGVQDAWGNTWWLATHIEDVSEGEMERRNADAIQKRKGRSD